MQGGGGGSEVLGKGCVDVLIATPGRLMAHLSHTPGFTLAHLKFLVGDGCRHTAACSAAGVVWGPTLSSFLVLTCGGVSCTFVGGRVGEVCSILPSCT
jgi:hypothetical protein